jgi:hypothetical protein
MRLTGEHAEFYRQHKTPMPAWAREFMPRARVSIDTCIAHHANAPRETDAMREAGNLSAILAMVRKRLERARVAPQDRPAIMRDELARMAQERHNSDKRKAIARKWANRIARDHSLTVYLPIPPIQRPAQGPQNESVT